MESAVSKLPVKVTEGVKAVCSKCNETIYNEWWETCGVTGKTKRFFVGSFTQEINPDGEEVAPLIPFCSCKSK